MYPISYRYSLLSIVDAMFPFVLLPNNSSHWHFMAHNFESKHQLIYLLIHTTQENGATGNTGIYINIIDRLARFCRRRP